MIKKNIYKILSVACLILLYGCESFLDITPTGKVIPETLEEFRSLMTDAYRRVPENRGLATLRSDEIDMTNSVDLDQDSYLDIWTWNDDSPSDKTASFEWKNFYFVIYISNNIIENSQLIQGGTAGEINQLTGEAYMMRAYMHFLLVNLYGTPYSDSPESSKAIPLKLNTNTEDVLSRNTVAEVYEQVLKDIDEAEKRLNIVQWSPGLTYRFNMLSVHALRSRIYLYMGRWKESLAASEAALAVKSELSDLTTAKALLPNHYSSVEAIVSIEKIMTSQYLEIGRVSPALINMYMTGDQRKSKYFKALTVSTYTVLKGGGNNFRCSFRTGEMYMNAAEAACQNNEPDIARERLLTLMSKRYSANAFASLKEKVQTLSGSELLNLIYEERTRELAFEGHRWFDLRRTTRPKLTKEMKGQVYTLEANDVRYTIRIPRDAIANNPNLAN